MPTNEQERNEDGVGRGTAEKVTEVRFIEFLAGGGPCKNVPYKLINSPVFPVNVRAAGTIPPSSVLRASPGTNGLSEFHQYFICF